MHHFYTFGFGFMLLVPRILVIQVFLVSFEFTKVLLSSLLRSWCAKKATLTKVYSANKCVMTRECWWWVWEKVLVVAWSEAVNVWKVSQVGWFKASRWSRFGWWLSMNHIAHTYTPLSAQGGRARRKTAEPLMRLRIAARAFCQAANAPHIQNKELWPHRAESSLRY
jgi:hypothetical protein